MARLKDRQHQIPGGFKFSLPEAGWKSQPYMSFDSIVNSVTGITKANPALSRHHGWPTERDDVANWVDEFNAYLCETNGWNDYITGAGGGFGPPKLAPPGKASAVVAGAKTLADWIGSGAQPVTKDHATHRAATCLKCPILQHGDWSNFFTRAASEMIRMQVQTAQDLDLTTPHDSKLGICGACSCPMRLKVFVSLKPILENILPESKEALWEHCWIRAEEKAA